MIGPSKCQRPASGGASAVDLFAFPKEMIEERFALPWPVRKIALVIDNGGRLGTAMLPLVRRNDRVPGSLKTAIIAKRTLKRDIGGTGSFKDFKKK